MGAYTLFKTMTLEEAPFRFAQGRMGLAGIVDGACNIWHIDKRRGDLCVTPVWLDGEPSGGVWAGDALDVEDVVYVRRTQDADAPLLDCPRGLFPRHWSLHPGPTETEQEWLDLRRAWLEERAQRSMGHYVLVDREPIPEPDIARWSAWFERADDERQVALTTLADGTALSTVFLSIERRLPHAVRPKQPLLFELVRSDESGVVSAAWFESWETALSAHESLVAQFAAEVARAKIGRVS